MWCPLHHEDTKSTKDTKTSLSKECFVRFVAIVAFVIKGLPSDDALSNKREQPVIGQAPAARRSNAGGA
jgi:hypothetical protein